MASTIPLVKDNVSTIINFCDIKKRAEWLQRLLERLEFIENTDSGEIAQNKNNKTRFSYKKRSELILRLTRAQSLHEELMELFFNSFILPESVQFENSEEAEYCVDWQTEKFDRYYAFLIYKLPL